MRHIKMYESWLNEASGANVPSTLDKGLRKMQTQFDSQLIDLSSYGVLSSQVRSYIDRYRNQYLNSTVWDSINTEAGLNKSINDFKELYRLSGVGNVSPLILTLDNIFKEDITDRIWYAKETVKAAEVIKYGDDTIANSLGAGIILAQLGNAITKGLYYISSTIPMQTSDTEMKNVKNALDSYSSEDIGVLDGYGRDFFTILKYRKKTIYTTAGTHGRTFPSGSYLEEYKSLQEEKLNPFVNNLSIDYIKNMASTASYPVDVVKSMYSVLFLGVYVTERVSTGLQLAVGFMRKGGPSWYQEILA